MLGMDLEAPPWFRPVMLSHWKIPGLTTEQLETAFIFGGVSGL